MPDLTADAVLIDHLPRDPLPHVTWWQGGQERAVTVRLAGAEQQLVAIEEYAYPDGRRAYRLRRRNDPEGQQTIRVWWDDAAMRWGWLPPGRNAVTAGRYGGDGPVKRRSWAERDPWPTVWVHLDGVWQEGWLHAREDWPDGQVVYEVGVYPGGRRSEGLRTHRVAYRPRSVQPRQYGGREDGAQA